MDTRGPGQTPNFHSLPTAGRGRGGSGATVARTRLWQRGPHFQGPSSPAWETHFFLQEDHPGCLRATPVTSSGPSVQPSEAGPVTPSEEEETEAQRGAVTRGATSQQMACVVRAQPPRLSFPGAAGVSPLPTAEQARQNGQGRQSPEEPPRQTHRAREVSSLPHLGAGSPVLSPRGCEDPTVVPSERAGTRHTAHSRTPCTPSTHPGPGCRKPPPRPLHIPRASAAV